MDDRELDNILKNYAESTRNDKDVALKRLKRQPKTDRAIFKRIHLRNAFAMAMCVACIVLCVVLPIALSNTQTEGPEVEMSYCDDEDFYISKEGHTPQILDEKYKMYAHYPNPMHPDFVNNIYYEVVSLRPKHFNENWIGATIGFGGYVLQDGDFCTFSVDVELTILTKPLCFWDHRNYAKMSNIEQWKGYEVRYEKGRTQGLGLYELRIYFTDDKYGYFVKAESTEDMSVIEFLDQYYA